LGRPAEANEALASALELFAGAAAAAGETDCVGRNGFAAGGHGGADGADEGDEAATEVTAAVAAESALACRSAGWLLFLRREYALIGDAAAQALAAKLAGRALYGRSGGSDGGGGGSSSCWLGPAGAVEGLSAAGAAYVHIGTVSPALRCDEAAAMALQKFCSPAAQKAANERGDIGGSTAKAAAARAVAACSLGILRALCAAAAVAAGSWTDNSLAEPQGKKSAHLVPAPAIPAMGMQMTAAAATAVAAALSAAAAAAGMGRGEAQALHYVEARARLAGAVLADCAGCPVAAMAQLRRVLRLCLRCGGGSGGGGGWFGRGSRGSAVVDAWSVAAQRAVVMSGGAAGIGAGGGGGVRAAVAAPTAGKQGLGTEGGVDGADLTLAGSRGSDDAGGDAGSGDGSSGSTMAQRGASDLGRMVPSVASNAATASVEPQWLALYLEAAARLGRLHLRRGFAGKAAAYLAQGADIAAQVAVGVDRPASGAAVDAAAAGTTAATMTELSWPQRRCLLYEAEAARVQGRVGDAEALLSRLAADAAGGAGRQRRRWRRLSCECCQTCCREGGAGCSDGAVAGGAGPQTCGSRSTVGRKGASARAAPTVATAMALTPAEALQHCGCCWQEVLWRARLLLAEGDVARAARRFQRAADLYARAGALLPPPAVAGIPAADVLLERIEACTGGDPRNISGDGGGSDRVSGDDSGDDGGEDGNNSDDPGTNSVGGIPAGKSEDDAAAVQLSLPGLWAAIAW
ncbi:unnamed protein product, partial [Phaeothamnion confervicola]